MSANPQAIQQKKALGLTACTALVVGNMVGSGIFMLPAALAAIGPISLFAWLITATGAIVLAILFGRLATLVQKTGGPYAYTEQAYGPFAGFLIAWGYWTSLWIGNAAVAVALAGYVGFLIPEVQASTPLSLLIALGSLWLLTWVNILGVQEASLVQLVTTVLKLLPLILIGTLGFFWINPDYYTPLNVSGHSHFSAISAAAALTLWAYLGLESATVPSGEVVAPEKTIPRATIIGVLIASAVYFSVTAVAMGVLPSAALKVSNAPLADVAVSMWGAGWALVIALGAIISGLGTLNGYTLLLGRVPYGAAQDRIFPAVFGRLSRFGTPATALICSNIFASILIVLNFSQHLMDAFNSIILLAIAASLLPYSLCSLAELLIRIKGRQSIQGATLLKVCVLGGLGFLYSGWALWGVGAEIFLQGMFLFGAGIPLYVWMQWHNVKSAEL